MFYDRFLSLCRQRGESPSRAAANAGLSKATVSKWKQDGAACPSGSAIAKLTRYFGVSVSELLGSDADEAQVRPAAPVPESTQTMSFYDQFTALCRQRGESPSRVAVNAGLSKSTVTKWKQDPAARPTGAALAKLTAYFGIPTSQLLGEEPRSRAAAEEELKFALFGGSGEITDEMFEEVRHFAAFVKEREAAKRRKE